MSFEDRLGELLKDEDPLAPGPEPAAVIAGARRRRARRRVGAGAAALAVALVCGVTAVTAGSTRHVGDVAAEAGAAMTPSAGAAALVPAATPTPTPTATRLPPSPVRQVAPGEKIPINDDTRIWVTATERCDESHQSDGSWHTSFGCRDANSNNLDHTKPTINTQGGHGSIMGMYLGPTPSRIVAFQNGKPVLATLVTTEGMKGWVAYYAAASPASPADPAKAADSFVVAAYDAGGKLLAENPIARRDGSHDHAPATL